MYNNQLSKITTSYHFNDYAQAKNEKNQPTLIKQSLAKKHAFTEVKNQ